MVNCYSEEYLKMWDIIEERYSTKTDPLAKKNRDRRARELRKEGYTVTCEKWSFPDVGFSDMYTIEAKKRRENDQVSLV
jgi:hypothetical protein